MTKTNNKKAEGIKFLNLDEVKGVELVVKLDGTEHKMKEMTVDDFISNYRLAKELSTEGNDFENEMNGLIKVILRAFPTIKESQLRAMKLSNLRKLNDFINEVNGDGKPEGEGENPPKAAS